MNKQCILCGASRYQVLYKLPNNSILKCSNCGLVSTLTVTQKYDNYHRDSDYQKFEKHFRNIFGKRYQIVQKYKKGKTVLDVGASTGTMLDIFKEKGWTTYGVEPSTAAKIASSKGHKILNTTFEKAKYNQETFDLIIFNHTLEHVDNPFLTVSKAYKLLNKGGLIYIDVPNFNSVLSKLKKEKWPYLLPNEHTFHFTKETLTALLEKNKFEVLFSTSRSGIWEFQNPIMEIAESLFTFKKRFFENLINLPLSTASTILDKGDSISIIGVKK